jgi:hypothetical protein
MMNMFTCLCIYIERERAGVGGDVILARKMPLCCSAVFYAPYEACKKKKT